MNGTPPRNLERRTRADQLEANRRALMKAAVHLVGKDGYAKTSVVRITTRAGLGQGTFYTYFDSRQELFDLLLPEVGNEILEFVRARVVGSKTIIDVEERSFKAFVDYLLHNPAYIRILIEAGTMAPKAGAEHTKSVVEQHVATLMHAWEKGQLPSYSRKEIPSLSAVLLALRMHFVHSGLATKDTKAEAQALIEVSLKVIRRALLPDTQDAPPKASAAQPKARKPAAPRATKKP